MSTISSWVTTTQSFTEEGNKMKEIFLATMVKEKIISQEDFDEMNKYCFVVAEKNFFGRIWNKLLFKNDSETPRIIVVKILDSNKL